MSTNTVTYGDFGIRSLERIFLNTEKLIYAAYQWKQSQMDILEYAATSTALTLVDAICQVSSD